MTGETNMRKVSYKKTAMATSKRGEKESLSREQNMCYICCMYMYMYNNILYHAEHTQRGRQIKVSQQQGKDSVGKHGKRWVNRQKKRLSTKPRQAESRAKYRVMQT